MKKTFKQYLLEAEEDKPLFDDEKELDINEPEEKPEGVKNPQYDFEITGNFDFKQLEKIVKENEFGIEVDKFMLHIYTKGVISDEDYEGFIKYIEDKIKFLKFDH